MKRRLLWSVLITLFSACIYAAESQTEQDSAQNATPTAAPQQPATPTTTPQQPTTPTTTSQQPGTENQSPAPDTTQSSETEASTNAADTQNTAANPPKTKQPAVNCEYKIPAETKTIDDSLILTWAKNAAIQSFDFDYNSIDQQISTLKACYTEQGWKGFNDALQKSGNLKAIKSQNLTVSGQVDGEAKITDVKENQWKVALPLQVVYQNNKEKLTQLLTVNLLIGRKTTGDLGIMQLIAMPRKNMTGGQTQLKTNTQAQSKP
ncbi:type IV secretion protein IcmL [Legionella israelensis]|uniref:DotI/IcmL family type IV secretion protein n=1 Tax=Legionella israelensis TaxID=454 RepID=UPI00117D61B0|nr:DotI/IcmL family type IV secretion protein [Legionella israelensis]QDP73161.1 type IV secretion protein IcmL [Legionella israelensis]